MNKLILREFKGCGACNLCKEEVDCKSFNTPISITFNKSQKADDWGRLVTVFSKGETVQGYAIIKDNEVYCASAKSNIYDEYEDFINLNNIDIEILK